MRTALHRAFRCSCRGLIVLVPAVVASLAPAAEQSTIRFNDATAGCGIDFAMTCGKTPSREILEVNGGGVAMFDFDNDGDLDLFFANGAPMGNPDLGPGSRLYANNGDGTFKDVTRRLDIVITRWAMGVAVGDYNNDGYDDLYVTCYGPNILLQNSCHNAIGGFVDVTEEAGVGDDRWGTSAAFGDIDGDGDLDLYVANYLEFDVSNPPDRSGKTFKGVPVMAGPAGLTPQGDVLYENLGNGTFRDITRPTGCVPAEAGYGLGTVILDMDGDGKQDIYVGNDSTENFLFRNLGNGRFQDIGVVSGIASNYDGNTQATMGIAIGDVDANGSPDVFTTNFSSDTNTLHLNLGSGLFDDRTSQFGLAMVSRPFLSWGTGFYDFDLDGDEDLFIASGHVYPETATHEMDTEYRQRPLLFERRPKRFHLNVDAGEMFSSRYSGRATAFGDIDDDGDVDIVMTTLNGPVHIFRNDSPRGNVVVIQLQAAGGNHRALGSMVELVAGDRVQRRWIHGGSYQSSDAPIAYFGVGPTALVDDLVVRVTWPWGTTTRHRGIPLNRKITIRAGAETFRATPLR
ncbi:MAG: CRTAC1 family protein [Phycisphaerae bacterium]